jgi:hypothetical protein
MANRQAMSLRKPFRKETERQNDHESDPHDAHRDVKAIGTPHPLHVVLVDCPELVLPRHRAFLVCNLPSLQLDKLGQQGFDPFARLLNVHTLQMDEFSQ